jgi:hypothetical protein
LQRIRFRDAARILKGILQMTDQPTADAKKVAFKTKLLIEQLGFTAGLAVMFAPRTHMIKVGGAGRPHRVQLADGGWIEIDPGTRRVVTWGPGRTARDLATALKADDAAFQVENLEAIATAAAQGASRRASPVLTDSQAKGLADRWRECGFKDVIEDARGIWIGLDGGTRLYDTGGRVTIYGAVTDQAVNALVDKAHQEWSGGLRLFGTWTDRDRERVWLQCQRMGVTLDEYTPSPALVARWEAEQAATARGAGAALRPDDATVPASVGPVPPVTGSGAVDGESEAPDESEPDLAAFDRKFEDLDRRQDDLERRQRATVKERVDALMREQHLGYREAQDQAFRERDEQRQEEERLTEARAILARARELAIEKGLDYKSAVALAKAEHLAEQGHDYEPRARLRR